MMHGGINAPENLLLLLLYYNIMQFPKYYVIYTMCICKYIITLPGKSKDGINDRSSEMILLAKSTRGPIR